MSYAIVKKLHIKEGKVYIESAASNSYPRHYYYEECLFWSRMLKDEGGAALDKDIMRNYWSGMLRGVPNKWSKAVDRFMKDHPEYKWGSVGDEIGDRYGVQITHTYEELKEAMYPYLKRKSK